MLDPLDKKIERVNNRLQVYLKGKRVLFERTGGLTNLKCVEESIFILKHVSEPPYGMGVSKSSIHKILSTLTSESDLVKNPSSKIFACTFAFPLEERLH